MKETPAVKRNGSERNRQTLGNLAFLSPSLLRTPRRGTWGEPEGCASVNLRPCWTQLGLFPPLHLLTRACAGHRTEFLLVLPSRLLDGQGRMTNVLSTYDVLGSALCALSCFPLLLLPIRALTSTQRPRREFQEVK